MLFRKTFEVDPANYGKDVFLPFEHPVPLAGFHWLSACVGTTCAGSLVMVEASLWRGVELKQMIRYQGHPMGVQ